MLIVARHLSGRRIKGETTDFHPGRDFFRVTTEPGYAPVEVSTDGLKAVFFVRSLEGDRDRSDHREFKQKSGQLRPKLWLEFKDGECMAAWPVSMPLGKHGFYVIPTDNDSNIEKAYVFRASVNRILQGDDAIAASQEEADRRKASVRDASVFRVQ